MAMFASTNGLASIILAHQIRSPCRSTYRKISNSQVLLSLPTSSPLNPSSQKRKENGSTAIFASTKTKNFSIVLATIKTKNLNKPHPLYHRSILVFCKMAKVVIYQVTQKHYNPNLTKVAIT